MKKRAKEQLSEEGYQALLSDVVALLDRSRRNSARAVNHVITSTYWEIGRRIVEQEQRGSRRAEYGEQLMKQLALDLTDRFGRGFSQSNIFQMRQFFLTHQGKFQTASGISAPPKKFQTLSGKSQTAPLFPLSWSHYVRLLTVKNEGAQQFYEEEALRGGWSVRQLDRQIATQFYEREKQSKRKPVSREHPEDTLTAQEEIRDPFVLEFLDLKDEYSENQLEEALILHLEHFLLELGNDFAFVARQKRLRVGDEWYRIDLLLFHRRLRTLILIDLKLGKFTHADAGQMNLYLNYAREHWMYESENDPVGLILCSEGNEAVAHYALGNLSNTLLTREYKLRLPSEDCLADELAETRKALVTQRSTRSTQERD